MGMQNGGMQYQSGGYGGYGGGYGGYGGSPMSSFPSMGYDPNASFMPPAPSASPTSPSQPYTYNDKPQYQPYGGMMVPSFGPFPAPGLGSLFGSGAPASNPVGTNPIARPAPTGAQIMAGGSPLSNPAYIPQTAQNTQGLTASQIGNGEVMGSSGPMFTGSPTLSKVSLPTANFLGYQNNGQGQWVDRNGHVVGLV